MEHLQSEEPFSSDPYFSITPTLSENQPSMAWATASNVVWGQSLKVRLWALFDTRLWKKNPKNAVCYLNQKYLGLNKSSRRDHLFYFTKIMMIWIRNSIFWEKKFSRLCIKRANKCNFRDWPQIMFKAVAEAMLD